MSIYLNNIISSALNDKAANYAICHGRRFHWYMFDVDKTNGMAELLWMKNPRICLLFTTEEVARDFLDDINMPQENFIIVNIRNLHDDDSKS